MNDLIVEKLRDIENEHAAKVLFAVESGSRAWGFPSQDSDYDVRFVYIRKPEWYLSIDEKRDVIEVPINERLDIHGWDIRKALKLFRKSNPQLLEWLVSNIVYEEAFGFRTDMLDLKEHVFSPKVSMHHYLNMAKGNFRTYLQGERVNIKKYFYALRPILACKWIETYHTNPPILFQDLVHDLVREPELQHAIEELLRRKTAGEELSLERRVDVIHHYIEHELQHVTVIAGEAQAEHSDPTDMLDRLFRKYLLKVWELESNTSS